MKRSLRASLLVLSAVAAAARADAATDDRSLELVRRDCSTRLGRNELTLFANGTIRLREWRDGKTDLFLAELGREEVGAYRRRFAAIDLSETPARGPSGVSGEWVERCELNLAPELDLRTRSNDPALRTFHYGTLDTFDLGFSSILRIVDELQATAAGRATTNELPAGYKPRPGDVLARGDGVEFEVVGFTVLGDGVELRGLISPLTIYVSKADLPTQFVRLVRRLP